MRSPWGRWRSRRARRSRAGRRRRRRGTRPCRSCVPRCHAPRRRRRSCSPDTGRPSMPQRHRAEHHRPLVDVARPAARAVERRPRDRHADVVRRPGRGHARASRGERAREDPQPVARLAGRAAGEAGRERVARVAGVAGLGVGGLVERTPARPVAGPRPRGPRLGDGPAVAGRRDARVGRGHVERCVEGRGQPEGDRDRRAGMVDGETFGQRSRRPAAVAGAGRAVEAVRDRERPCGTTSYPEPAKRRTGSRAPGWRDGRGCGRERSHRHHRDVPPHDLRAGRGGHRAAAGTDRRAPAPERADRLPDRRPDGARRAADRRGRSPPRAHRRRASGSRPG